MTNTRRLIEEHGRDGRLTTPWSGWADPGMAFPLPRLYRVEAHSADGGFECSYQSYPTITAARAHLAWLQADPAESARYDTWDIVRYQPSMTVSIVEGDPLTNNDLWVEDHQNGAFT